MDGNLEYEVEAILRYQGKGARRQYLVSWKGYDLLEASWEPESHLANAPNFLADYLYHIKAKEQSTRTIGTVTSAKGACGELPQPGCICIGREELVLGSSMPFG